MHFPCAVVHKQVYKIGLQQTCVRVLCLISSIYDNCDAGGMSCATAGKLIFLKDLLVHWTTFFFRTEMWRRSDAVVIYKQSNIEYSEATVMGLS